MTTARGEVPEMAAITSEVVAAMVRLVPDAVVVVDGSGRIVIANDGADAIFGFAPGGLKGSIVDTLVPDHLHRRHGDHRADYAAEGTPRPMGVGLALSARRRDGTEFPVDIHLAPVQVAGERLVIAAIRDLTERHATWSAHATADTVPSSDATVSMDVDAEFELRRLVSDASRRERWQEAISEIRLLVLSGGALAQLLDVIVERVCELAECEGAAIALASADDDVLTVVAACGEAPAAVGDVLVTNDAGVIAGENEHRIDVPVATSRDRGGVLAVVRSPGRPGFGRDEIRLIESLAERAGMAVEIASGQDIRQELALIADRERIARDLHDHVIQRLFAVGMSLQAAGNAISDERARRRIDESVEELDDTIRDVRSTIFSLELRATERIERSTRARILEVASRAAPAMGFQARLHFEGPIDTTVPEEMVGDLVAVVREALSNVARHAHASAVEVRVVAGGDLTVIVSDDGRGLGSVHRSSGLSNLRARAEARRGTMSVGPSEDGGTRLEWRVPISAPS